MSDGAFYAKPDPTGSPIDQEVVQTSPGGQATNVFRQRVRLGGAGPTDLAKIFANGSVQVGNDNETQAAQHITTSSGAAAGTALGLADAAYPAGSTVVFQTNEDHSSIQFQVAGTFTAGTLQAERSLDGVNWFPTNVRRNAAGNHIANLITAPGLYVGVYGGTYKYRLRALTDFVGDVTIYFSAGVQAATYLISEITSVSEEQYFSSSAGGNSGWQVHSQDVALAASGTEYSLLWLFNNDAAGGRVLYIARILKAANNSCRIRRYRTGPGGANMTRTSGGSLLTINNRANQAAAATAAVAYGGNNIVVANQPAYYEKSVAIGSQGGGLETVEGGGTLIPPQTGILFTALAGSANMIASIEAAYWDGLTLP